MKILNNSCHSYSYFQAKINLLARTEVRLRQLKPVFHFTISLARRRPALDQPTLKQHFHAVYFLYNTQLSFIFHLPYEPYCGLIYVGQSYSSVGHQYTRVGQTVNPSFTFVGQNVRWLLPHYVGQFHEWVGPMSVTDRYFKACYYTINLTHLNDLIYLLKFD